MDILQIIKETIPKNSRVVLALSGGPDSVYLFHRLLELRETWGLDLVCAHLHHGIRKEADQDLIFVKNLCQTHGVRLVYEVQDVPAYAKREKITLEEAGRALRYDLFYRLAGEDAYIALAHHLQDQAETLLMRLMRGTGILGLGGMRTLEGQLFRPLLGLYKEEIVQYLDSRGYAYCLDQTNFQPIYARNKVRLELIPYMKDFNPRLEGSLAQLALQCQEAEDCLSSMAREFLDREKLEVGSGWGLALGAVNRLHKALSSRVFRLLLEDLRGTRSNISNQHIEDILFLCKNGTGKQISLPDGYIARVSYDNIIIERPEEAPALGERPLSLGETVFGGYLFSLKKICNEEARSALGTFIVLDSPLNLLVRRREPGDRIQVQGLGTKKVKDIFIDKKIDRARRDLWPIVLQGEDIIWIPGLYRREKPRDLDLSEGKYILEMKELS